MGESLYASESMSLKMDRLSPEAARLREVVSKKLSDFLGDFSDDVLAEYIVVLVCNGKQQNQVCSDLQAFLGDESRTFVTWLWDYISNKIIPKETSDLSDPVSKVMTNLGNSLDREYKSTMLTDHDAHSAGKPNTKNESLELPHCRTNPDHLKHAQTSERLQLCPSNLAEHSTVLDMVEIKVEQKALHRSSSSKSTNYTTVVNNISSSIASFHEVSSISKLHPLQYELQNQKISKNSSSSVVPQCIQEPKTEQTAMCLRSVIAEEHSLRPSSCKNSTEARLPPTAIDELPHQAARVRGNVWDRLGRPHLDDQTLFKEENSDRLNIFDIVKVDSQEPQNPRLTRISSVTSTTRNLNRQSLAFDRGDADEGIPVEHYGDNRTPDKVVNANALKRKREISEHTSNSGSFYKENYLQDKGHSQHQELSILALQNNQQRPNSSSTVVSQSQVKKNSVSLPIEIPVPISTAIPANSKSQSVANNGNVDQKPEQYDVLAVKLKLRQIEMDLLKLRSKKLGQSFDGKQNTSSVLQNVSEEGIESRTVLVTNVHFAATRESLVSHFGICGQISKVIMLTDAVTGLPKGATYIVFASKDSAEKAISLSGTSFFSRILKVIRKVEVPSDFLVPSQLQQQQAVKQLQPFYAQAYGKGPPPMQKKQHTSSHLQWRRDQRSSNGGPPASVD